jgi:two-component system, LytTR family, sensor kinase
MRRTAGGVAVAAAIALGIYAHPPTVLTGADGERLFPRVPGPPPDFRTLLVLLGVGSIVWYAAVLALPLMLWGAKRLSIAGEKLGRTILIAAAAFIGLVTATSVIQYLAVYRGAPSRPELGEYLPVAIRSDILPWIAVAATVIAVEAWRRAAHATLERERLRAVIAEQRLVALTGQLQPHFLFNTLQGISTLIHRDPESADEMLAKLSDLLRALLRHHDQALVPLEQELSYVRTYLDIAHFRFADRLRFDIEMKPELGEALVPLFILQPLVENAIGHGVGSLARGGRISIRGARHGNRLQLEVLDDGAGLPPASQFREGIGIANTRERLRASFEDDQLLELESRPDGGTIARVLIPWRTATPSTASA